MLLERILEIEKKDQDLQLVSCKYKPDQVEAILKVFSGGNSGSL